MYLKLRYGNVVEFLDITHPNHNRMNGTIKTLTEKGFGFISREGEVKDLFFHSKDLSGVMYDELHVGDAVSFDVVDTEKGAAAKNVSRV